MASEEDVISVTGSGFGSKAGTLLDLAGRLEHSVVLPMAIIRRAEWDSKPREVVAGALSSLGAESIAVRSSAVDEDMDGRSNAGRYDSFLNVAPEDVLRRVEGVFDSFGNTEPNDEVFLQPMVAGVELSGVAFSRDPSTGSDYRVIEYTEGDDPTLVTAGLGHASTLVCVRGWDVADAHLASVIRALEELEGVYGDIALDIEFAFSRDHDQLVLLQVRPLVVDVTSASKDQHVSVLDKVAAQVSEAQNPHPFLGGASTVFGIMPDWNPAEVIGTRPRPLAMSLYRDVITDSIWAYQRSNYGYRNLRGHPLMVEFAGQPFIDVRVSFNSFIPADLPPTLASRLVDHYLERLVDLPKHHDKVEFEIVYSCYVFGMDERLEGLLGEGFSQSDTQNLSDALRRLTNRVVDPSVGLWKKDWERIAVLEARRREIADSNLNLVSRVHWLLEDCRRYGTLPFAGLARCGFIARQIVDSLVETGILTAERRAAFMASISTVNSRLVDSHANSERDMFLAEFGHLRPGTYEITSKRYDETPDDYFDFQSPPDQSQVNCATFEFTPDEARTVDSRMKAEGLVGDAVSLLEFLRAGIELREEAKFQFTRNISDLLVHLVTWGEELGLSRDELSFVRIDCVRDAMTTSVNQRELLSDLVVEGRANYALSRATWLPSLIVQPEDVYCFEVSDDEPNFVTQQSIIAGVGRPDRSDEMKGRIAIVASADPGYDWLFAAGIVGLITAYGGVNSHMAIRSYELGLPAAIGIGERRFSRLLNTSRLLLDCGSRRIEVIE